MTLAASSSLRHKTIGVILALLLGGLSLATSAQAAVIASSKKSGLWSDPSLWSTNLVPRTGDPVKIGNGHVVEYDVADSTVAGVTIDSGGTLAFSSSRSATLNSTMNVVVFGKLMMQPSSPSKVHTLRFIGVDESRFVGGGNNVLATDVGLWAMTAGQLQLSGSGKTAWARLAGSASAGDTTLALDTVPTGWAAGDELSIAPTEAPTVGDRSYTGFDDVRVSSVADGVVTLDRPLAFDHPKVNGEWTAEVLNLSRNVRIEGMPPLYENPNSKQKNNPGRSHILIRNTTPVLQTIANVAIRYMGPRRSVDGRDDAEGRGFVPGRYGVHLHNSGGNNRGSTIEGTVVRDAGSHAFAVHATHGVTLRNNITYRTIEAAYWWDPPAKGGDLTQNSADGIWDGNVAASVRPYGRDGAFVLGSGLLSRGGGAEAFGKIQNIVINSVAVGTLGGSSSSGFSWGSNPGLWEFANNVAHNNSDAGIAFWNNSKFDHVIGKFITYHNVTGINHGGYANHVRYEDGTVYGNRDVGIAISSVSNTGSTGQFLSFDNVTVDGAGFGYVGVSVGGHNNAAAGDHATVMSNFYVRGHASGTSMMVGFADGTESRLPDLIECSPCFLEDTVPFYLNSGILPDSLITATMGSGESFALRRFDQSGTFVPDWNARRTDISSKP